MYLIVTRNFPPEIGGMQSLIWGLSRELSKNYLIKFLQIIIMNIKNLMNRQHFQSKELVE